MHFKFIIKIIIFKSYDNFTIIKLFNALIVIKINLKNKLSIKKYNYIIIINPLKLTFNFLTIICIVHDL